MDEPQAGSPENPEGAAAPPPSPEGGSYEYGAEPPNLIEENKDARMMGMLAHLLGAFVSFLGPLIIWLIKRDEMPFVDDQGKESLNFQLTILIAILVLGSVGGVTICIGISFVILPLAGLIPIFSIVMSIIGAVKANNGEYYRYPITIRMIK